MTTTDRFALASIAPFFMADTLAVIGASTDPRKQGGRPVRYCRLGGFKGGVYPIHPVAGDVEGMRAYPSLSSVEGPVECAFIALPAPAVERALRDCVAKGVRAAIIISAGFAEVGDEGRRHQERLVAIARSGGMRLVGPNCMGAMNVRRKFFPAFLTLFGNEGRDAPRPGTLSLVSQSGAFGSHAYALARARGAGFAKWITTGNQCDVQVADCIAYFAEDPDTTAIMVYMEGSPDPGRLMDALQLARNKRKPVILLKAGRSALGSQATLSHTGSLAGSDEAFDGLCAQTGVHRAGSIDELLDVAVACAHGKYPSRAQVGLITISGGVGALMADYADELGLAVPALPAKAQEKLLRIFPHGSARNPIDPTALWSQDVTVFGHSLRALFGEGGHDAVVLFASTAGTVPALMVPIREQVLSIRDEFPDKLIVISIIGSSEVVAEWREMGFLVYEDPRRALEVISALAKLASIVLCEESVRPAQRVPRNLPLVPGGKLTESEAMSLLERADIAFTPRRLAQSRTAAERAAGELGFPVVVKVASPDIAHKSEIGGVALNLLSRREVGEAYDLVMRRAAMGAPKARIDGVVVARHIVGGVETILGVSRDPALGPVVMFGMGGLFVEVYRDVTFRVAPISVREAHVMIRETKGYPILAGARRTRPVDVDALARAISRLSLFATANAKTIRSIDINPFIVLSKGKGGFGVDALIECD